MTENISELSSPITVDFRIAPTVFAQAWENVRHIRGERISFTNVYTAVVAGGLALLQRDFGASASNKPIVTIGLLVLLLFSIASLLSSIRLVAELRNSIANLQRVIDQTGVARLTGMIEPPHGLGARLPVRWVFPIYFGLTTAALIVLLVVQLAQ